MKRTIVLTALLVMSILGCSDKDAQELYMTAQVEERQNNVQHAKELYQQITTKYPNSSYAKDAQGRLAILSQDKRKQE